MKVVICVHEGKSRHWVGAVGRAGAACRCRTAVLETLEVIQVKGGRADV